MDDGNAHLAAFQAEHRLPGESVLAWALADEGAVVLTEKRLCLCTGGALHSLPVTESHLRYRPFSRDECLIALFQTDGSRLEFSVRNAERGHLGALLGNIAELREAHDLLEEGGLDPAFVSPHAGRGGGEGLSAIYQLMRLKELANQGLLGDIELRLERSRMMERFRDEGAARR